MVRVFFPLAKSAVPAKGRLGKRELQDWYRSIAWIVKHRAADERILIVTGFVVNGHAEVDVYREALRELGVETGMVHYIREGNETISQLDAGLKQVLPGEDVVLVATWLHAPRVWWLTRKLNLTRKVTFGIPRPYEAVTDIVLTFLFPVLDTFGGRAWFLELTNRRRLKGAL